MACQTSKIPDLARTFVNPNCQAPESLNLATDRSRHPSPLAEAS